MPDCFEQLIVNRPYARTAQHCALDGQGQPTQYIVPRLRPAELINKVRHQVERLQVIPNQETWKAAPKHDKRGQGLQNDQFKTISASTPEPRSNTCVISSDLLGEGSALDDTFRKMASDDIERSRSMIAAAMTDRLTHTASIPEAS